jgi:ribonuclease P protein component
MTATPAAADVKIERLKIRADFLRAAKAQALSRGAVFIQLRPRGDDNSRIRAGFTATKKIGGSVERNRAKRRLREAARLLLPLHGRPSCDYVFIARGGTRARPWARLLDDVKTALISLAAELDRAGPEASPDPSPAPSDAAAASDPSVSG